MRVRQPGETLSLSPNLQAPGLQGRRVTGRQGPAPKWGDGCGKAPKGLHLLTDTPAQGQAATAARARAADTFMIEKQLQ